MKVIPILSLPFLSNLSGLDNLSSVGGQLIIRNIQTLSNLDALTNLVEDGRYK